MFNEPLNMLVCVFSDKFTHSDPHSGLLMYVGLYVGMHIFICTCRFLCEHLIGDLT